MAPIDPNRSIRSNASNEVCMFTPSSYLKMLLLTTCLLGGCLQNHGIGQKSTSPGKKTRQAVFVDQSWSGEIPQEKRIKFDEIDCITNQVQWQKIWHELRGTEPVPPVDFKEYLVML